MASNELIYQGSIRIKDPISLFSRYHVTKKEINRWTMMIEAGNGEKAIDEFIAKYTTGPAELYTAAMQDYLRIAESGEVPRSGLNKITTSVVAISSAYASNVISSFSTFVKEAVAPTIFEKFKITSPSVKQSIFDATIAQFGNLTEGAMTMTQNNILTGIRQMQMEMIQRNQAMRSRVFASSHLDKEVDDFKKRLKQTYPNYYKGMEEGRVLMDRNGKQWKLEDYATMATRTTILNVERTSVEIISKIGSQRVVEYFLRDSRTLSSGNEREICKEILSKKVLGKSVLAMDLKTARILGVFSLDTAKAKGAMGPWCRHSIRPVSKVYNRKLNRKYFPDN